MLIATAYLLLLLYRLYPRSTFAVAVVGTIALFPELFSALHAIFSTRDADNSYKLNMLSSYSSILNHWRTLAFGEGFQGVSWDVTLQKIVALSSGATKTELTPLELLRVFGLLNTTIIFILMATFLLKRPVYQRNMKRKFQYHTFILLLIDSIANPNLFSTYGGLMIAIALADFNDTALLGPVPEQAVPTYPAGSANGQSPPGVLNL
jgi:hypothetical protein